MQFGSYEHRKLFCQDLIDRHIEYDPNQMPWPQLGAEALQRVQEIPLWATVLQRKRQLALVSGAVAAQIKPTLLKAAISLQAAESKRQVQLLENGMAFYQISQPQQQEWTLQPKALAPVLMDLAFNQYLDDSILWGWFALVRERQYLPNELLDLLDPLLNEDSHHSIFFANWMAGQRFRIGHRARQVRSLGQYSGRLLGLMNQFGRYIEDATLPQTASTTEIFLGQLSARQFLESCIKAHDQRLADHHPPLVKPHLAPQITQWLLKILAAWPQRKPSSAMTPS